MKKPEPIHERLAELPAAQLGGVVVAVVEDPYATVAGGQIAVLRAIRDDPLAGMLAREQIDLAQFHAGREWQRHWENAGIGPVRGIDPTQEPVSGKGPVPPPFTDRQHASMAELRTIAVALGYEGDCLVREILGDRIPLQLAADRRGKEKRYVGVRFRECLETMAGLWGFA